MWREKVGLPQKATASQVRFPHIQSSSSSFSPSSSSSSSSSFQFPNLSTLKFIHIWCTSSFHLESSRMAEYVAVRPFIKFPVHGSSITELSLCPQNRRKCYAGWGRSTKHVYKAGGFCFTNLRSNDYQKVKHMKCYCLGTLISTAGDSSAWIPVTDQVLLMASIFLTHMAGVVPADGPFTVSGSNKVSDNVVSDGTSISVP